MENTGENGIVLHEDQTNSIHTMNERENLNGNVTAKSDRKS